MIDPSIHVALWPALLFYGKEFFWGYMWPAAVGFVTIAGYQMCGRIMARGTVRWPIVFFVSAGTAMLSLLGWVTIVRSLRMVPMYGCGVGMAYVMMSRMYAVIMARNRWLKVRLPYIIWRGDGEAIERLQTRIVNKAS